MKLSCQVSDSAAAKLQAIATREGLDVSSLVAQGVFDLIVEDERMRRAGAERPASFRSGVPRVAPTILVER